MAFLHFLTANKGKVLPLSWNKHNNNSFVNKAYPTPKMFYCILVFYRPFKCMNTIIQDVQKTNFVELFLGLILLLLVLLNPPVY